MTVIAIDVKTLSLHGAGIATFLRAVLPGLVERTPALDWVALGPSAALDQLPAGVRRVRVDLLEWLGPPRLPFYDQVQLRAAVRRQRAQAFYSPYFDAPARLAAATVVTMHDAVHLRFPKLYPTAQRLYYQGLMRMHGARAAAIVTDSEFSKSELVELAGIDSARIHVVHLSLPASFTAPADGGDPEVLRRYHLPAHYLLYTGGVEQRKNVKGLLEAYALWRERRKDVPPLALTGHVARFDSCRPDLARLGLSSSIVFPGRVAEADLPHVYAGARAVVYPSRYEGFGFPLLEAMTCGVPIACSDCSSLPEVAADAARYFDPDSREDMADAMDAATFDPSLRAALASAGRRRVAHFSVLATVEALARVLLEACAR